MVQIICDSCGKTKAAGPSPGNESWILGYDLETETQHAINHSIRFLDRWDDRRVLELGTIHLCSEQCRGKYIRRSRAA
jgi:hypothetical protein